MGWRVQSAVLRGLDGALLTVSGIAQSWVTSGEKAVYVKSEWRRLHHRIRCPLNPFSSIIAGPGATPRSPAAMTRGATGSSIGEDAPPGPARRPLGTAPALPQRLPAYGGW
jgi:hypothetical protein